MDRFPIALLVLLVTATLAPTATGLSRASEASYVLATGLTTNVDPACQDRSTSVNGACFHLYPTEKHVILDIRDSSERNVAAEYAFHDGDLTLATGAFCGSSAIIPVPKGAKTLVLFLGEPGRLDDKPLPGCQLQRGVGGIVSAAFR
jgi:hypothetical protein